MKNYTKSALIVIDMENGFVNPESAHCIKMAKESVPACVRTVENARKKGIPVFFVKRIYRSNGCDVELTRYNSWVKGGRGMAPGSTGLNSAEQAEGLKPQKGDYTIVKPRWSAFFHTELDLILRRLGVETVVIIGTTTPNCVRSTAYDANSLEYNVVIVEDACSSATQEIQDANIADMRRMGAHIMSAQEFDAFDENTVPSVHYEILDKLEQEGIAPETFVELSDGTYANVDRW